MEDLNLDGSDVARRREERLLERGGENQMGDATRRGCFLDPFVSKRFFMLICFFLTADSQVNSWPRW